MTEPDLIYVAIDTPIEKRRDPKFVGLAWTEEDNSCEHVKYIRKDALIEWANSWLAFKRSGIVLDDGFSYAMEELTKKLNSL